jgi:hypothetical protein
MTPELSRYIAEVLSTQYFMDAPAEEEISLVKATQRLETKDDLPAEIRATCERALATGPATRGPRHR